MKKKQSTNSPTLFISHTESDKNHAEWLAEKLRNSYGKHVEVFLAHEYIDKENRAYYPVQKNARQCKVFISLLSPASINAPWVSFEAGAAWVRKVPCVAIYFGGISMSEVPSPVKQFQVRKAFDEKDISYAFTVVNGALNISTQLPIGEIADYFLKINRSDYPDSEVKTQKNNTHAEAEIARKDSEISELKEKLRKSRITNPKLLQEEEFEQYLKSGLLVGFINKMADFTSNNPVNCKNMENLSALESFRLIYAPTKSYHCVTKKGLDFIAWHILKTSNNNKQEPQ